MEFLLTFILVLLARTVSTADRSGQAGTSSGAAAEDDGIKVTPKHGFKIKFIDFNPLNSNPVNGYTFTLTKGLLKKIGDAVGVEYDKRTCDCSKMGRFDVTDLESNNSVTQNLRVCDYGMKNFHVGKETTEEDSYVAYIGQQRTMQL